ncbi:MAG TPA: hydroxymethylbilane synthase [Dehalococcoidia bacterium]|nr:hydroxymethylbilane synthase [Dehalococcoidia bacterium]
MPAPDRPPTTDHRPPATGRTFVIGARGSRLSLRQVELVSDALRAAHPDLSLEVREIRTEGDRSSAPLAEIGGLGVFTKAIEDALLAGDADIAVHSMKDLPAQITVGLTIAAVPARADVRDALVTRGDLTLALLPPGARIGTGSGRRAVLLRALRPDVVTAEIRGNVDTRIRKVESGDYDGAVLALAGLERLGLAHKATHVFSLDEMLPAVGQGALAVQVRADDAEALALVSIIDDAATRACVEAERAYLARLGAGCRQPVGAHAVVDGGELLLKVMIAYGERIVRAEVRGGTGDAAALGTRAADMVAP